MAPRSGFEPESKPRQGFMMGRYTTGALPFSRIGKSYIWLEVNSKSFLALGKNRLIAAFIIGSFQ
jgi:hypothetical protein